MSKRMESNAAARWREIVRGHATSGLSVAAYCRRARVPASSFYAWRRKLRDADALHSTRRSRVAFAEVRVAPEVGAGAGQGALEVRLPRGRCVIVRPGFDRQTLLDLVATLEGGVPGPANDAGGVAQVARRGARP